jgi:uncharacterized protein YprB with RNaseH-like and TPR domain
LRRDRAEGCRTMIENLLRKQLAAIKARALEMRRLYALRRGLPPEVVEPPCRLETAVPGVERVVGSEPVYWVRTEGDAIAEDAERVAKEFSRLSGFPEWFEDAGERNSGDVRTGPIDPYATCFFDIETTGLVPNTYVFLCGMMYLQNGRFVIEQAFARDYAEEAGLLFAVRDLLLRFPVLVTFNGASFDVPFVRTRMVVARIANDFDHRHVDLIGPARRVFAGTLPNCKLETIQTHLRRLGRQDDIPGRDIPDAYHEFVRSGDARKIKRILYHNRMDLIAMAHLVNHLVAVSPDAVARKPAGPPQLGL